MPVGGEGIECGGAVRHFRVDQEVEVFGLGVAVAEIETVESRLARVECRGGGADVVRAQVIALAVREVAVAIFAGEVEEAAVADRQTDVDAEGRIDAVARLALTRAVRLKVARVGGVEHRLATGGDQAVEVGHAVQRRHVLAVADLRPPARIGGLELDVDDACNGIGAILRRRAIAQHLDLLDRERRDHVHVDGGRAAANGAIDVEQRGNMAALAVEQHQRLIGVEAAQRRRAGHVGAIGDRRLRKVERRDELVERLVELARAGCLQRAFGNDVDRHDAVRDGAVGNAATDDDDVPGGFVLRIGGRFLAGCRSNRLRPCRRGDR
eukprot:TRINITY_DN25933_c0_g1_i1.p2 TRINITY_DN25933_c0_g1~~TRINITY_DN25933_c0_g1_i1.p2  ORF type:complete len:324 (-),score=-19.42 TRINITY_DN25933_c0_g1_i1:205-1176(-)